MAFDAIMFMVLYLVYYIIELTVYHDIRTYNHEPGAKRHAGLIAGSPNGSQPNETFKSGYKILNRRKSDYQNFSDRNHTKKRFQH